MTTLGSRIFRPPAPPRTPPPWWRGSFPEYLVYQELLRLGMREGLDFVYQSSQLGGKAELGGIVVDFYFESRRLAINISGLYWHYQKGGGVNAGRDRVARTQLAGIGVLLVFVDEDHVYQDVAYYVSQALAGVDHSRIAA